MTSLFQLEGRTTLITGGTRGIGRVLALHFARAGARVLANYVRNAEAAASLEAAAADEALHLQTVRADIAADGGRQKLLAAVEAFAPRLDIFIHAAATGVHRPVAELTLRHFDWTFQLNVRAFFHLVTQLLPRIGNPGAILAFSSAGAHRAVPHYTLVGSTKAALEAMVRHFAAELAPRGIRVNAISPGTILTEAWDALPDREARLAEAARRSPLGRLTAAEEVAATAQFLCSDAASGIVGQTLIVDGGYAIVA